MSIKKSKKKVIVSALAIFIILFISYSAIVFKTINPISSFTIWKSVAVDGNDFYEIQEGTYAGGNPDIPNEGYVFVSYQYSAVEAMDKIGFHAIIEGRLFYLGGYLLEYRVVGEA
ncbi:MAG: hypothetical protein E7494_16265 [Ruminococcus albus]|nr:hypothetical protein [Ruminococcus albus]